MALKATKTLRIGSVIAALPGNLVTEDAAQRYGWTDVEPTDVELQTEGNEPTEEQQREAKKQHKQRKG